MADVGIDANKLTDGYLEKLRAATTEVARLERRAKSLAKQQREIDERRAGLEAEIETEETAMGLLGLERSELQKTWMDADFDANAAAKRDSTEAHSDRHGARAAPDEARGTT